MPREANIDAPSFNFQKQRVTILTLEKVFTSFLLRVKALCKACLYKAFADEASLLWAAPSVLVYENRR